MSEKSNTVFEEYVPSFKQYLHENDNMPAGAAFDKRPGSPYEEYKEPEWEVKLVRMNQGYLEFRLSIDGAVKYLEADLGDEAVEAALEEYGGDMDTMIAAINAEPGNMPEELHKYIEDNIESAHDQYAGSSF
jgi:NADH:ubiquinone oxidoreductase subunit D